MFSNVLINKDKYDEIKHLDELIRELQNQTLNEDWGYWHFSLLNLDKGENLESGILSFLSKVRQHKEPYNNNISTGSKTYSTLLDLKNLKLISVKKLKDEIISKAEYWAYHQGPTSDKKTITEKFDSLKIIVAENIFNFLTSKGIIEIKLVTGIDTFYSFGGDHCGDDILIATKSGIYVIHFGFSS